MVPRLFSIRKCGAITVWPSNSRRDCDGQMRGMREFMRLTESEV